jgi:hypothetical protein
MAFSRIIEGIEKGSGKFDLERTFFINNSSNEDIIVSWGLKEPEARGSGTYTIRAGEKGGPYPHFLAYHIVKALVSREMQKDGKGRFFGSAEMRAPYEDKFLIEIAPGDEQENPLIKQIREEERAKLVAEMQTQPISSEGYTSSETRRQALEGEKKRGRPRKETTEGPQEFEGANR